MSGDISTLTFVTLQKSGKDQSDDSTSYRVNFKLCQHMDYNINGRHDAHTQNLRHNKLYICITIHRYDYWHVS